MVLAFGFLKQRKAILSTLHSSFPSPLGLPYPHPLYLPAILRPKSSSSLNTHISFLFFYSFLFSLSPQSILSTLPTFLCVVLASPLRLAPSELLCAEDNNNKNNKNSHYTLSMTLPSYDELVSESKRLASEVTTLKE